MRDERRGARGEEDSGEENGSEGRISRPSPLASHPSLYGSLSPCTRGERAGVRGDSIPRENSTVLQTTCAPSPLPLSPEYRGEGIPQLLATRLSPFATRFAGGAFSGSASGESERASLYYWRSTMKRAMCIYLPRWPVQNLWHLRPELRDKPVALTAPQRGIAVVTFCCPRASRAGIRPGMPARSAGHAQGIAALRARPRQGPPSFGTAGGMGRARIAPSSASKKAKCRKALLLDITGCAACFHGEDQLGAARRPRVAPGAVGRRAWPSPTRWEPLGP